MAYHIFVIEKPDNSEPQALSVGLLYLTRQNQYIPPKMEVTSKQKKGERPHCCGDRVTHGPIHHQAGVNFDNFAEMKFRDFSQTGTDV